MRLGENKFRLIGRLTEPLESKVSKSGKAWMQVLLDVPWGNGNEDTYRMVAFQELAEDLDNAYQPGTPLMAEGYLKIGRNRHNERQIELVLGSLRLAAEEAAL